MGYYSPQLRAYRTIVETAIGGPAATPVLVFARETVVRTLQVDGHEG